MANGITTGDPRGFNKRREGSRVRQTPEEGWKTYQPKRCGNNNKDEDNSPKTLNDKNHQASSQKFRQLANFSSNVNAPFYNILAVSLQMSETPYKKSIILGMTLKYT